jgi:hypothetical protein
LNTHKKVDNKKEYIEDLYRQEEFTKAMEGPGGYFLEHGRQTNIKDQPKKY